jgi:branched-subunit amino acid ABC-type transport system permease component
MFWNFWSSGILYRRDHMEQVLATFGLILFFNELIRIGFGPAALYSDLPPSLSGFVEILPDTPYPAYRLGVILGGACLCVGDPSFCIAHPHWCNGAGGCQQPGNDRGARR